MREVPVEAGRHGFVACRQQQGGVFPVKSPGYEGQYVQ